MDREVDGMTTQEMRTRLELYNLVCQAAKAAGKGKAKKKRQG